MIIKKVKTVTEVKPKKVMYKKAIRLFEKKIIDSEKKVLRFPEVYHTLSWLFHLKRSEAFAFLKELQDEGYIRIVPFHGIELMVWN